jgi:hypothetical protein
MYLQLVVKNQNIVKKFINNFKETYNKYFERKPYLIKNGDYWSVTVGFLKPYFPHQVVKTNNLILLSVELDIDMLIAKEMKRRVKKNLTDNEGDYLVERYLTQEGKKNKDILKKVSLLVVQFINDVSQMCNSENVIYLGSALKSLDLQKKICKVCGKEFIGSGKRIYCSEACKQKAKRQRKNNRTKEERRKP